MARIASRRKAYTAAEIDALVKKAGGAKTINDGAGLVLRQRSSKWLWYFRTTSPETGRDLWISLAPRNPYPATTLAAARQLAATHRISADSGIDPNEEKKRAAAANAKRLAEQAEADRRSLSVRELFQRWRETDLRLVVKGDKRTGRKDSGLYAEQQFERHVFPYIGHTQATNVRRADVMALLDILKAQGSNRTANVILALLRQMFRFAAKRDLVQGDPTFGIEKKDAGGKDHERERVLTEQELRQLGQKAPAARLNPRTEAAIWLLLATAARVGELVKAKWPDFDIGTRTWTIPAENSKNGRAHVVHLSDFALRWLERLASLRSNPVWVFPNVNESSHVCTKTLNKQFSDRQHEGEPMSNRARNTTALALAGGKWVPHDLRRTAATRMQALGVSSDVIDRCLNHTEANKVTRTYQRDDLLPQRREAFQRLGEHLEILCRPDTTNVVTMRRATTRA